MAAAPEAPGGEVTFETFMVGTRGFGAMGGDFGAGAFVLEEGRPVTLEVDGTWSQWRRSTWNGGVCEGTAEPLPNHPSKDVTNDLVGLDFAFRFAAPNGSSLCTDGIVSPRQVVRFEISLDGGQSFFVPQLADPVCDPVDHRYRLPLAGQGEALQIRLGAGINSDNHGQLRVLVKGNTFAGPPGDFSVLARNADGSFSRRLKDGTVIDYDADGLTTAQSLGHQAGQGQGPAPRPCSDRPQTCRHPVSHVVRWHGLRLSSAGGRTTIR